MRALAVRFTMLVLFVIPLAVVYAESGRRLHCCCAHCGCNSPCQKVCRLVCEEKRVEVICFGCQCEHFCIPGPSRPACQHCECLCESCDANCDCTAPVAAPKTFLWTEWIPGCASVVTKKKLMRRTETVTVLSYKWVVEDVCANCDAKTSGADITPGVEIPAPPIPGVRLKVGVIQQPQIAAP
jgi:hypothetical protein